MPELTTLAEKVGRVERWIEWLRGSNPPGVWVAPPGVDGLRGGGSGSHSRPACPGPLPPRGGQESVEWLASTRCQVRVPGSEERGASSE